MKRIPAYQHINEKLKFTDRDFRYAASKFGTPVYLYDAEALKRNFLHLRNHIPEQITIYYSVKANPNRYITRFFYNQGTNVEVASYGELMMVKELGVSDERIILVGPGKSSELLEEAVESKLFQIVAESKGELERIYQIAKKKEMLANVSLRINPDFKSGSSVSMSGNTQFGMDEEEAVDIFKNANQYPYIYLTGIHVYVGTKQMEPEAFLHNTAEILKLSRRIQKEARQSFSFLDIGGGLGIPYHEREKKFDFSPIKEEINQLITDYLESFPSTHIAFESGRFLVGSAGVFLTKVLDRKIVKGNQYLILDGGINNLQYDNQIGARIPPMAVVEGTGREEETVTVCGPLCTPADRIAQGVTLPKCEEGDLIAFYQAGAYGTTIAPGLFLSHGYPTEIMYENEAFKMIRKPFQWKEILKLQEVD